MYIVLAAGILVLDSCDQIFIDKHLYSAYAQEKEAIQRIGLIDMLFRSAFTGGVHVSEYKDLCIQLTHTEERKAVATGECVCRGDPHCYAFDADRFNNEQELFTPNVCGYVMATDSCPPDTAYPNYFISAVFERVKYTGSARSFVSVVIIEFKNPEGGYNVIALNQGMEVTYDGQKVEEFPKEVDGHKFEIVPAVYAHPKDFAHGVTKVISYTLPNGINVQYDGIKGLKINVDSLKEGTRICGLCGNNDGVFDNNDYKLGAHLGGQSCENLPANGMEGTPASNKESFVNSWYRFSTFDEACQEICPVDFE
ncbi:hypothetical protein CAPTEDRAFT_195093 [Capitella teleta]|uniref:VWFD domain-containing protein n=1 Tax=Capitella teleta TaxID=283909 RepID=R7UXZ9_CAPTE|nr:hypothetical protein CAPTEDRAFT_195093 [Capitella teleta]|eukprot:ELU08306.1 hypothetical protein CAPTEDRAFT_195093 [Capitella teleta]